MGICWLVSGILPLPIFPSVAQAHCSPHERFGGRAVETARLPSHLAPLGPPLDFNQHHGEGLMGHLVPLSVPVPSKERVRHARGEGELQHLP